jgi:hypothetical protein
MTTVFILLALLAAVASCFGHVGEAVAMLAMAPVIPILKNIVGLDANETAFFSRELEYVKSRTYDKKYPEYKAQRLIPVSSEAGNAAESIVWREYDSVGLMKLIANYAVDLPRSDVFARENISPVRSLGGSYGYNIQEVRNSSKVGKGLEQRKADAARLAYEQAVNRLAWFARAADGINGGLTGLIYQPNITVATIATRGGHVTWADKTAAEILLDLNEGVSNMIALTKGVEIPNTVLLPEAQYGKIATTPAGTGTDTTILKYFLNNRPEITAVEWVNELDAVSPLPSAPSGAGTGDLMIVYKRDSMNLELQIPQMFEQFPVQQRGLEFLIPTHARIGGVTVYYPLSISIYEGI